MKHPKMVEMTREQHIARHRELHKMLDELVADYVLCTRGGLQSTTLATFIQWSQEQSEGHFTRTVDPGPPLEKDADRDGSK